MTGNRYTLLEGPSTVFWVAVVAWTVVMRPSTMPNWIVSCGDSSHAAEWLTLSLITLARGARQLVVHEAFEMTWYSDL